LSRAVNDAALAGVMLNPQGNKLVSIIEEAIRLGAHPELVAPQAAGKAAGKAGDKASGKATGMTGKGQAATCSAKGTPPCPSLSSLALTLEPALAACASSTGAGG